MSQFATIAMRLLFAGFCLLGSAHSIQAEPVISRPHAWERYAAVAPANPDNLPVIAIVIDDVGLNARRAQAALALPAPMTIAILPYSQNAAQLARDARALGHEVLLHLPMQAVGGENPGPEALLNSLSKEEFDRRLVWNLAQLDGYVGVSNHMGSLLTQDHDAMTSLFSVLRQRGLMFLDSKTAPRSVGASLSRSMGLPTLSRDIFLDNVRVPVGNIVVPAGGFARLMEAFDLERCGNATMALAQASGALEDVLAYVQARQQFGKPLADFQAVQLKLAEMQMEVEAARLLIWRAAINADKGLPSILDSSTAKCFANQIARNVTGNAVQMMGGYGYSTAYPMERRMRDAWGWGIAGGAIDIQKVNIASAMIGRRFDQRR